MSIGYLIVAIIGYLVVRSGLHSWGAAGTAVCIYCMSLTVLMINNNVYGTPGVTVIVFLLVSVTCPVWVLGSLFAVTIIFLIFVGIFDGRTDWIEVARSILLTLVYGTIVLLQTHVHHWDLRQLDQQRTVASKNEKKYRNIFDNSHEAIVLIDKNDEVIEANRTFFEQYKIPRNYRTGSTLNVHLRLAELFPKQERRELRRVLTSTAGTAQTRSCELNSVSIEGQMYPVRIVASSLRTLEDDLSTSERTLGSSMGVPAGTAQPVQHGGGPAPHPDTQQSPQVTHRSRKRADSGPQPPVPLQSQPIVTAGTERSMQPLLMDNNNQSTIARLLGSNAAQHEEAVAQPAGHDEPLETDFDIYTDDEDTEPISPSYQYQPRGTPVPSGWYRKPTRLVSIVDLTDQRRVNAAESEALKEKQANEAKSRFLANMSHEVRTPLNCILGMTQIMMTTSLNDEQSDYLGTIKVSAQILLTVINDILDFSKIEAGQLSIDAIPFNFVQITENIVDLLFPSAATKNLLLSCYIDPKLPRVFVGDPNRFQQILVNLVSNGIKFTTTGSVSLRCLLDEDVDDQNMVVRFEIIDTGIGIEAEALDRLFQRFSQVDSSITRSYGGTGLGLVICKSLVNLMGGTIGVDSTLGQGSRFWFTIKFRKPTVADSEMIALSSTSMGTTKRTPFASDPIVPQQRHSTENRASLADLTMGSNLQLSDAAGAAAPAQSNSLDVPGQPAQPESQPPAAPTTLVIQTETRTSCMEHLRAIVVSPRRSFQAALELFLTGWNVNFQSVGSWTEAQRMIDTIDGTPGARSHTVVVVDHPNIFIEPTESTPDPDKETVTNVDWHALLLRGVQPIFCFPDRRVETQATVLKRWPASHIMVGPIRQSLLFSQLSALRCPECCGGEQNANLIESMLQYQTLNRVPSVPRDSAYANALTVMALPTGRRLPTDMHEHLAPVTLDNLITPVTGVVSPDFPSSLEVNSAPSTLGAAKTSAPVPESVPESSAAQRSRLRSISAAVMPTTQMSPVTTPPTGRAASMPDRSCKLLVVEDNMINQKVVCTMLRKAGYRFDVAVNGQEAVDMVKAAVETAPIIEEDPSNPDLESQQPSTDDAEPTQSWCPYDLILMDCQMPVLDGYEATIQLRKLEAKYKPKGARLLPILAMTAEALPQDRARCFECGMTGYISKPISYAQLLAHLKSSIVADSDSSKGSSSDTGLPAVADKAGDDFDKTRLIGGHHIAEAKPVDTATLLAKTANVMPLESFDEVPDVHRRTVSDGGDTFSLRLD
ncbi:response regulator receiver, variant 2 [Capsaspora owczarzaki ATCC 30864]|nr:response regulator receiver, variant 2 [Capsaspora owczarzaki ATCC 30864]